MTLRDVVLVFCRAPRAEQAAKPLSNANSSLVERLHAALLERALAAAAEVGADVQIVTPEDTAELRAAVSSRIPQERFSVVLQQRGGLAARMEVAVGRAFEAGYRRVVAIGGDTPEIDSADLRAAFAQLAAAGARAVLGPSVDGGYYLLGLNQFSARAFREVPFHSDRTCAATERALRDDGFEIAELRALADVDSPADVRALAERLRGHADGRALRALALLVLADLDHSQSAVPSSVPSLASRLDRARGPPEPPR